MLAAGLSRRFGRNKLLEPFRGKPILRWVVEAALRSRLNSVTVVLGFETDRVKASLDELSADSRLRFALNPSYRDGQSASVIAGLAALPDGCDGAMFMVGDQPLLDPCAIDKLIAAFARSDGGICYPVAQGRRGNPVVFGARYFSELRQLRGDSGGRSVIERHPDACVALPFPSGALRDIDHPAEAAALAQADLIETLGVGEARVIALCGSGGKTSLMAALVTAFAADPAERILATTTTKLGADEIDGPWHAQALHSAAAIREAGEACAAPLLAFHHVDNERGKLVGFSADVIDDLARQGCFTRILVETDGSRRRPLKAPDVNEPIFPPSTDAVIAVAGLSGLQHPLDERAVFHPEQWAALTGLAPGTAVTPASLARVIAHPQGLMRGAPKQATRIAFLNQADSPERCAMAQAVAAALPANHGLHRVASGRLQPDAAVQVLDDVAEVATTDFRGENR